MTADRPLAGVAVLVPRAPEQASRLSLRIRELGGEPVEAPTIAILPGDDGALDGHLRSIADGGERPGGFVAVCLTSPNGVRAVRDGLERIGQAPDVLTSLTIAVVGPGTARTLRDELGLEPDLVPDTSTTTALGDAFPPGDGKVLLPRADIASPSLPDRLRAKGYDPVEVDAYVTGLPDGLPSEVRDRLSSGAVDLLAFTSSSTVRNFATLAADVDWRGRIVSIGPVTTRTCRELGFAVALEAERHDLDGLVEALVRAAGP